MSPSFKQSLADPDQVFNDLSILAKYVSPKMVRVVGGEPFIHPRIEGILSAVRASNISKWLRVVTNGVFLDRASAEVWSLVDEIYVSQYPGFVLPDSTRDSLNKKAADSGVRIQYNEFNHFRESYTRLGSNDDNLVKRIFRSCRIAHSWQCHTVHDGYYHLCPMSLFHSLHREESPDAVKIVDSENLITEIRALIDRPTPLKGCNNCLGNAGKRFAHSQVEPGKWLSMLGDSTESVLDEQILSQLEADPLHRSLRERLETKLFGGRKGL